MKKWSWRGRDAAALRQSKYRASIKELGGRDTRVRDFRDQSNRHKTRWDTGEFVAIDGEGFSEGEEFSYKIDKSNTTYTGKSHYYAYISASDGSSCYSHRGRLDTFQILDFLCNIVVNNPNSILVCFGGSYDVCHSVAFGLDKSQIKTLLAGGKNNGRKMEKYLELSGDEYFYRLEYRPRKSFTIRRWPIGEPRYIEANGQYKLSPHVHAVLWDVWGFYQDSFIGVMKKWIPNDIDFKFIERMKGSRNIFNRSEIEEIKEYNQAELRCLVKVMNLLRIAIGDLGLKITRWDGAGSIAASMMQKHRVKKSMTELPNEVFEAARYAYSGGHIEVCQLGYHNSTIYHYDINSAYPDQFRRLPDLVGGCWSHHTTGDPHDYALVKIQFEFPAGQPFYPLFFRHENGTITYPSRGTGWYHCSEYEVAKEYAAKIGYKIFDVLEYWQFTNDNDFRPFLWVEEYYKKRKQYIETARRDNVINGAEKIIKLGLSSLYGKTCQQVGARIDKDGELKKPSYFQLDWGGYVTAGCRAKLMRAALLDPSAIIAFATDALFSTRELPLECPDDKILGAWERTIHDGITMVMPGVYWLHDGQNIKNYSRGFDKQNMAQVDFIHQAWRRKQTEIKIECTRLIGLGTATTSDVFWEMRGCFVKCDRKLQLDGENSKRYPITLHNKKPHNGLIVTWPKSHALGDLIDLDYLVSAPYPIIWLSKSWAEDDNDIDEINLEEQDATLA